MNRATLQRGWALFSASVSFLVGAALLFEAIVAAMNRDWMMSWACGLGVLIFGVVGAVEYRSGRSRGGSSEGEHSVPKSGRAKKP
jgi:hypothetical protein